MNRIDLDGQDLLRLTPAQMRRVRGSKIGMIFQEPMTALNPAMRIGDQIAEGLIAHKSMSRRDARAEALRLLDRVHMPDARRRIDNFPYEMSGGQRQGVAVSRAAAWANKIIFLDEPTAALGVVQTKSVLDLICRVRDSGVGVVLISHSMPDVMAVSDRVEVMRLGRRVAQLKTKEIKAEDIVAAMTGADAGTGLRKA